MLNYRSGIALLLMINRIVGFKGFVVLFVMSIIGIWFYLQTDDVNNNVINDRITHSKLTERLITRNEGVKRLPYLDSQGNVIIGVGHELSLTFTQANRVYPVPLNDAEIDALLSKDLKAVETQAKGVFPKSWDSLNTARKAVIMDMLFNLGIGGFLDFEHFIDAVKKQRWHTASQSILNSLAARQNPTRYQRNANVMATGMHSAFN